MGRELRRRTPEECLLEAEAEDRVSRPPRHLKIFLGYASGVGKTVRMLGEARRRRMRGQDVVVGAVQPKLSREAALLLHGMEIFPLLETEGGTAFDLDALLRRHPAVCVIDGLAYDNPSGLRHASRWQDVEELLCSGIKVIASINVQYVAELREQVQSLTGKKVTATVPMAFLKSADEIEIVDAPPEEPHAHTPEQQVEVRLRQETFSKLREIALVLAAEVVDAQLNTYLERNGMHAQFGAHERILVCLTPWVKLDEMLDTARGIAERFHAELVAAYVRRPGLHGSESAALEERVRQAAAAGARIELLEGEDPAQALLHFARSSGVTQLFVGRSTRHGWGRLRGSPLDRLIWEAHGMDVRVFPQ